ncbi:MAG: nucleoside triphosphate pyrophosphohydrolase [Phenylobacterium sp.]|uniref:nucleoside triphosphate pyrophosphohydrolase n=1 Tax=Phenylobacterium sp. TaxID=1871053 RepID=UPI00273399E6|nr:nucleoside triphosphate pyrophosphohydrolase [Phenylobacterium sp.]MDP3748759.1 nucleoside triphosphate pyrophosphohydrolase [Phenylobacterium sp.]
MSRLRFRVEKLIRDKLPQIMREQGLMVFDRRLDDAAYVAALKDKLVEEAHEARGATDARDLTDELADLSEVILALAAAHSLTLDEIETRRLAKRAERGGFDDRVYNAAVEAETGLPAADYYLARPSQYPRED